MKNWKYTFPIRAPLQKTWGRKLPKNERIVKEQAILKFKKILTKKD